MNLRQSGSAVTSGFSMVRSESDSSVLTGYGVYGTGDFGRFVNTILPRGLRSCRAFGRWSDRVEGAEPDRDQCEIKTRKAWVGAHPTVRFKVSYCSRQTPIGRTKRA